MNDTREKILRKLESLKPELRARFNVGKISLFGSFVREEETSESDVDLLVEFESPIGFFKFMELEEYLEAQLERKVDLVSRKALKPFIGQHILEEAITI